jgi:hypothetical protein
MDEETKQALQAMENRILERIENTETKLLRAFMGWGARQTPSYDPYHYSMRE